MADIFSGFNAVQGAVPMPQGGAPAIATLGNMIDALEQRRMARQQADRQQALAELAQRKQDAINAYHTRRLDLQDKRQQSADTFGRAKYNQDLIQKAQGAAAKGLHPGTQLFMDDQGNPIRVAPRFVPNQPAPAEPPAPAAQQPSQQPLVIPASLESTNVVAQALDRNPDADSADELGLNPGVPDPGALRAQEQRLQALPYDGDMGPEEVGLPPSSPEYQHNEAQRSRMLQQSNDPGGNIDLANPPGPANYQDMPPEDNTPPPLEKTPAPDIHAPEDEGQGALPPAGLMSPEASGKRLDELGVPPLPSREPPSYQGLQDALDSRGSNVPQADAAQPADFKRGKWVYDMPNGQPFEIDMEQARQAHLEEVKAKLAQYDRVLTNPAYANSPMLIQLEKERALLEADLGDKVNSQIRGQVGKMEQQQAKDAATMDRLDKRIEGQQDLERLRQEGKMALQNAKRKRGSGGSLGIGAVATGGGEYVPIPQTKYGPRPDLLMPRVTADWRSYSMDEKLPVQLLGLRRLKLADHNLSANGPDSGVLNIEAAFNYLGFVRGGVPVENETKEMLKMRRTWADQIHGFLARAGLGELAAKFMKGGELTKEEAAQAVNVMSPAEKARIAEGIKESLAVMNGQVNDTIRPFTMVYAQLGGPGGRFLRQQAVSMVNARLASAGLPADFNPYIDTKEPGASKFLKPGAMGEQQPAQTPSQHPAQAPSQAPSGGKPSFDDALQRLLEMKKKAKGGQ